MNFLDLVYVIVFFEFFGEDGEAVDYEVWVSIVVKGLC